MWYPFNASAVLKSTRKSDNNTRTHRWMAVKRHYCHHHRYRVIYYPHLHTGNKHLNCITALCTPRCILRGFIFDWCGGMVADRRSSKIIELKLMIDWSMMMEWIQTSYMYRKISLIIILSTGGHGRPRITDTCPWSPGLIPWLEQPVQGSQSPIRYYASPSPTSVPYSITKDPEPFNASEKKVVSLRQAKADFWNLNRCEYSQLQEDALSSRHTKFLLTIVAYRAGSDLIRVSPRAQTHKK